MHCTHYRMTGWLLAWLSSEIATHLLLTFRPISSSHRIVTIVDGQLYTHWVKKSCCSCKMVLNFSEGRTWSQAFPGVSHLYSHFQFVCGPRNARGTAGEVYWVVRTDGPQRWTSRVHAQYWRSERRERAQRTVPSFLQNALLSQMLHLWLFSPS